MTRCELSIKAEGLYSTGLSGMLGRAPSVYAVIKATGGPLGDGHEIGRTEILPKCRDPRWTEVFYFDTVSQEVYTPFRVTIYDSSSDSENSQSCLAEANFEATAVFEQPGHMCEVDAGRGKKISATVQPSRAGNSQGYVDLQIRGLEIKNVEAGLLGLGKTDPFFEIAKKTTQQGAVHWTTIYRSAHIDNHLNPYWDEFHLRLEKLCNCDLDKEILVSVYDYQDSGNHRLIGTSRIKPNQLHDHLSIRGNADRETALDIKHDDEEGNIIESEADRHGYLCVLKANFHFE